MVEITLGIVERLLVFNPCKIFSFNLKVEDFSQLDLIWAERILTASEKKSLKFPLWTFSDYGYGAGYGDGAGDGAGAGDGYGDGTGYGYGAGYGDGYGYGAGDGDGTGSKRDIGQLILEARDFFQKIG